MKKKDRYIHARTCVYNIHYHIIWCVKYRNPVLNKQIADDLIAIISDVASSGGFLVDACETGHCDHVHCFVTAPPTLSITRIVKKLKGESAVRLFRLHPELKRYLWKGHLWSDSYFAETIGSTSEENIRRYISSQSSH